MDSNINVALFVGGYSPERQVSKSSGFGVYNALKSLGYTIKIIDPAIGLDQPKDEIEFFSKEDTRKLSLQNYLSTVNSSMLDDIDTVFIALHGSWGEDGTLQSLLEFRNLKYTGSGILSSALSMNKVLSKILFQHCSVPTPRWLIIETPDYNEYEIIKRIDDYLGLPVVIKPNNQGSAIGLSICDSEKDVREAIINASKYNNKILIEEYVVGYEVTVGIINKKTLPVLEIKPKHRYYDYECKYEIGMSDYEVPADFPPNVSLRIQELGLKAYKAIGATSYGRVDFRITKKHEIFCLEVNTLPGLTKTSLLPKMAKADGIKFEKLIKTIIRNSLD
ncbi:D-alanine--D-alanine ligase [Bacteroidota bacterium]